MSKPLDKQWPIVGNEHIVEYLSRCLKNNKVEQTYIFEGPRDLGKNTVLRYFIQCLLCAENESDRSLPCGRCLSCRGLKSEHPDGGGEKSQGFAMSDIFVLKKPVDKKNLSIEQVKDFIKRLGLSSFMGRYKIGIIKDAETLSKSASNALLKTLEEPKKDVVIFLVTVNSAFLPATIVSRSQVLKFRFVASGPIYDYLHQVHGAGRDQAKYLAHLALGRPALALKLYKDKDFLAAREEDSRTAFDFFGSGLNSRLALAKNALDPKLRGQEALAAAGKVLDAYEGVSRDLLLGLNGVWGRLKHIESQDEIKAMLGRLDKERVNRLPLLLKQARAYLFGNVKPQTVLEYLAISF